LIIPLVLLENRSPSAFFGRFGILVMTIWAESFLLGIFLSLTLTPGGKYNFLRGWGIQAMLLMRGHAHLFRKRISYPYTQQEVVKW
jgi:hypothetical protein